MFKQLFLLTFVIILVNACEGVNDKQENTEQNSEPTVNTASDKAEDHTSTNEEIIVEVAGILISPTARRRVEGTQQLRRRDKKASVILRHDDSLERHADGDTWV